MTSGPLDARPVRPAAWWAVAAAVLALALANRLIPVLRGGGLFGLGNYDDGVHYAAAVGLAHGLLPYRDFLLLQPPGLPLLLLPFALLGRWLGDPIGMATARVSFMLVGSLTAVLVARWLRPLGLIAAAVGGAFYALFLAGAYTERSTLLEGPGNTLLIIALMLIARSRHGARPHVLLTLAGVALGLSAAIKIWAVAGALVIVVWLLIVRGWRTGLRVLVAAAAVGVLIAAPLLLSAPLPMWQMVVTDQLGRTWVSTVPSRLIHLAGLSDWDLAGRWSTTLLVALLGLAVAAALAASVPRARLPVLLLAVDAAVLVATPSAFLHYGALVAVPAALVVGAATARLVTILEVRLPRWHRPAAAVLTVGLLAGLAVWGAPGLAERWGRRFPAAALRPAATAATGCLGSDDPGTLIQLDLLGRNLARGCPLMIDLGGNSYHPPLIAPGPRATNRGWQAFALDYLRGNDLVIITRFRSGFGFDAATAREVGSWPTVARSGAYRLQSPAGG